MLDLEYPEIDWLLYPNIETGVEDIEIDTAAFTRSEQIQAAWLKTHPMPLEDALERIRLRTQASHRTNLKKLVQWLACIDYLDALEIVKI